MSKASDLRDAVITELRSAISADAATVEAVILPEYEREDLVGDARVGVRYAERTQIESTMGPDVTRVLIEVAVVGVLPDRTRASETEYREAQIAAVDVLDGISETIIALFVPNGALANKNIGDHRFVSINQPVVYDPEKMSDETQFLSIIELVFEDLEDE